MKTHPRVGGEALVSFSCTRAFALSRAIALARPDFWDPAGLSSDGSVELQAMSSSDVTNLTLPTLVSLPFLTNCYASLRNFSTNIFE